jgi:hypothetical protein
VRYAQSAPLSPRVAQVALLGTAPNWFEMFGVRYEKATSLPANADCGSIGADANVDEAALNTYLQNGGKVVFLPRQNASTGMGVTLAQKVSTGSLDAPSWPVARGLSASDLRWRNESNAWLVQGGDAQVGADGQLAMKQVGKGTAVWLQLDPERFNADETTYFASRAGARCAPWRRCFRIWVWRCVMMHRRCAARRLSRVSAACGRMAGDRNGRSSGSRQSRRFERSRYQRRRQNIPGRQQTITTTMEVPGVCQA